MRRIEVGRVGSPYGLEGGFKFRGEPWVADLPRIYLQGLGYRNLEEAYWVGEELVLHLSGVEDRTDAEALVGLAVYVDEGDLPELEEGSFYYYQLVGRKVFVDGAPFGEVVEVQEAGAQDLLVVKRFGTSLRARSKTYLVPFQAPYVTVRDDGIHIEAIPGLFD
ncbi:MULTISPECIES: ribosome maturation factor RimM [unclassified Meiothermus]|uniref:ribosome maturation factor RimM n=1 Tax=unclassified Meiothermus TaxID=370471 RepID=UPI000D7BEF0C|nr:MULTISPECIES: ribosome maturation factor RimM [unclassified Meiothermus]PZA08351.1 16S rRNA processing protein RimM [Meiothermus sp. Pnk-1]RYM36556.1 16S rRNA processing protein RimM [Meiothermus sp. PNK-Is4]